LHPPIHLGKADCEPREKPLEVALATPPAILPKLLPQNRKFSAVFLQSFRKWRVRLGRFLRRPWRRNIAEFRIETLRDTGWPPPEAGRHHLLVRHEDLTCTPEAVQRNPKDPEGPEDP